MNNPINQYALDGLGLELLTLELRGGAQDAQELLEQFAQRWQQLLPNQTQVRYHHAFLGLGPRQGIAQIEIHLGEDVFALEDDHKRIHALRRHVVHGVALSSESLPLEGWLEALLEALERESNHSRALQDALEQLTKPKSL